jgi:hypothetical protein
MGPFERHIIDAIKVNQERMPLYSALSKGKSLKLSRSFIRGQRLVLPIVRRTDRRGVQFQKVGIPIIELDMVEMSEISPFQETFDFNPQPISDFTPLKVLDLRRRIKKAYKANDFGGVKELAEKELERIEAIITFHGMTRHMLESFVRMACMAEVYLDLAKELNFKSPRSLSYLLMRHHMNGLFGCRRLDILAAPLQANGIPVIHQDVPKILPYPRDYKNLISQMKKKN